MVGPPKPQTQPKGNPTGCPARRPLSSMHDSSMRAPPSRPLVAIASAPGSVGWIDTASESQVNPPLHAAPPAPASARRQASPQTQRRAASPRGARPHTTIGSPAPARARQGAPSAQLSPPEKRAEAVAELQLAHTRSELEQARAQLATLQRKLVRQAEEHASVVDELERSVEQRAKSKAQSLARWESKAADEQVAMLRAQLKRATAAAKGEAASKHGEMSEAFLERCRAAVRGLATHGLKTAVLAWRRRELVSYLLILLLLVVVFRALSILALARRAAAFF